MQNALQASAPEKHYRTSLHTDTGYPVQTPNLYLTFNIFE